MRTETASEHPLRTWRINKRLKLWQASELLGVSVGHLCSIELGRFNPSLGMARKISKATGLSLEQVCQ